MPQTIYTQAEVDAMIGQVVEEGHALEERVTALESGTTPPDPPDPEPGEIKVEVYAWWPNANSLTEWESIGIDHFMIPKKLGRSDTPSVDQLKKYTVITVYDPSYSTSANPWIVANFIEPDEPDAAAGSRPLPVEPSKWASDAAAVKAADPSRPTFGSMGRSWVDLNYNGRGSAQAGKEEPLQQYAAAVDTMTFFCYPMTVPSSNTNAAIYRKIDCPWDGVDRMDRLAPGKKIGFCMEAGNIYNVRRPTYDEMMHLATTNVDRAKGLGHTDFKLVLFNMKTVGGYDGSDGLHNNECRRAMQDIAAMYA